MESNQYLEQVRDYLLELGYDIKLVNETETLLIIDREEDGIKNMVLDVADPILVLEQTIFVLQGDDANIIKSLLQKNMDMVHGAFALTEDGYVVWRDTLELENLDINELEGSLKSLSLLLSEYFEEILAFAKA
ncbi:MAG TPA: molecular chaperone Tir [Cytophagales bacterium]|nr:molecular chaperone Tir [Cytophagales bacterium]HAA21858.1 molecular chaperone Tir [Cytophagales bacterium]HAP60126.1 molecular chaperone Tir [Cytophagales bacterium]